ncbi:adenosylcobinamide-GDP ribazoletransferase [uncultured Salinisphaera sp.]|uniref:adenosylcobinamide-GDP ribazoletransferase n=1 Tax=uncultured Salinisphaera sp. TaxID=359372 RepID=UPI0032B17F16|tara:strand:- start:8922 stop:9707 length:786 start_codon:yes stop_codon:yes gene_type:complete
MTRHLRPLWLALVLLTTLPVARLIGAPITPRDQGRSVAWYPWVGALIGSLLAILASITHGAPPAVAAVVVLIVWVGLTGGLHLDGLADCTDGAFAGHGDPERTLAVMREPTAGPMAIIALVLVLLTKFAALVVVLGDIRTTSAGALLLVAVPLAARAAAAGLMTHTAYRRGNGIATDQAAWASRPAIWGSIGLSLIVTALLLSVVGALGLAFVALAATVGWRRLWTARIGGYTGDTTGGLIELVEALLLIVVAWGGAATWA